MFRLSRLNILIYIRLLIFQVLFLGIIKELLFIYLFAHIVLDLFDYTYAKNNLFELASFKLHKCVENTCMYNFL